MLTGIYAVTELLIYSLLVAVFRHWRYPLVIMTTNALGIAGAIIVTRFFLPALTVLEPRIRERRIAASRTAQLRPPRPWPRETEALGLFGPPVALSSRPFSRGIPQMGR